MAEKRKFQAIKGTRDLLPPETELWNRVEATAREVFGTFGFGEIRPPIFEPTELFARAVGGETDIVGKEMYSFEDHDFSNLAQIGAAMRLFDLSDLTTGDIGWFFKQVPAYSEYFTQFFTKGQIPKTHNNDWVERRLRQLSDEARQRLAKLEKHSEFKGRVVDQLATDAELRGLVEEFRKWHAELSNVLQTVKLGDEVSLRPEATASVCRAYIEHNMHAWTQPVKLYYMGPMFRRERPQKGRYRQFYQIGAEVLETLQQGQGGSKDIAKDAAVDAEVIEMVMTFFARLELQGVQLEINSIGHSQAAVDGVNVCRRAYVEKLRAALLEVKEQLGADSQRRIETNPLRVLDSKLEHEQAIIEKLPRITDHLCEDCRKNFAEVKRQLDLRGVVYRENWRLVRGLDYYMRTTFEITAKGLGSQNAVCGGGRYDGLVELLGGPATKGIGFAIGEDRLILSLQEAGKGGAAAGRDVYIAWMGEKARETSIKAAQTLREAGLRVELPPVEQKFGKALGQADKVGARFALILGEDEVTSGQWTVKTLADGTQEKIAAADLVEFVKRKR